MGTGLRARVPGETCPTSGRFCPRLDKLAAKIADAQEELEARIIFKGDVRRRLGELATERQTTLKRANELPCTGSVPYGEDSLQCGLDANNSKDKEG